MSKEFLGMHKAIANNTPYFYFSDKIIHNPSLDKLTEAESLGAGQYSIVWDDKAISDKTTMFVLYSYTSAAKTQRFIPVQSIPYSNVLSNSL